MYDNIEFVICCAGECTRNFPHSKAIAHKSLLPMGDLRLIDYTLKDIAQMGGKHITIVCSNQKVIDDFKRALATDTKVVDKLRLKGKEQIADIIQSTFLPDDIDLKYVIQEDPLGTAHVLYVAREAIQDRHVVLIFPDDIIFSQDEQNSHIKKLVDAFLKDTKTVLLTGFYREDVSNNAIIENNRIIEKPKNPSNHIAGLSPNVIPNEVVQYLVKQAPQKMQQVKETKKEWLYMDSVNDFLDNGGEQNGYVAKMFIKDDADVLLDTGTLPLYELCLLRTLLTKSVFKQKNRELAKQLLAD